MRERPIRETWDSQRRNANARFAIRAKPFLIEENYMRVNNSFVFFATKWKIIPAQELYIYNKNFI